MKITIETIDLQRRVRKNAFRKACQIFEEANKERWGLEQATPNQVKSVFKKGYEELSKAHPRCKWLNPIEPPNWITKLDYICARGGKPIVKELNDIIRNLGEEELPDVEE